MGKRIIDQGRYEISENTPDFPWGKVALGIFVVLLIISAASG
ncbi:MAG: hypothetical protein AAGF36_01530 [Pseudomonadota bacterium]